MSRVEKYEILSILENSEQELTLDLKKLGPYWKEVVEYVNGLKEKIEDLEYRVVRLEGELQGCVERGEDNE